MENFDFARYYRERSDQYSNNDTWQANDREDLGYIVDEHSGSPTPIESWEYDAPLPLFGEIADPEPSHPLSISTGVQHDASLLQSGSQPNSLPDLGHQSVGYQDFGTYNYSFHNQSNQQPASWLVGYDFEEVAVNSSSDRPKTRTFDQTIEQPDLCFLDSFENGHRPNTKQLSPPSRRQCQDMKTDDSFGNEAYQAPQWTDSSSSNIEASNQHCGNFNNTGKYGATNHRVVEPALHRNATNGYDYSAGVNLLPYAGDDEHPNADNQCCGYFDNTGQYSTAANNTVVEHPVHHNATGGYDHAVGGNFIPSASGDQNTNVSPFVGFGTRGGNNFQDGDRDYGESNIGPTQSDGVSRLALLIQSSSGFVPATAAHEAYKLHYNAVLPLWLVQGTAGVQNASVLAGHGKVGEPQALAGG